MTTTLKISTEHVMQAVQQYLRTMGFIRPDETVEAMWEDVRQDHYEVVIDRKETE